MNVPGSLGEQRRKRQVEHEGEGRCESEDSGARQPRPIVWDEEDDQTHHREQRHRLDRPSASDEQSGNQRDYDRGWKLRAVEP
jgi:hypothetical protein